ncbi:uncharacterized protein LOC134660090 isoform X2 [Cydia amplana]|uniref:uncharacterized protein LOC134660090 isoform X2 n=1 Tax=Cydia amplana TaxID=1869771 RepID=UPI002FE56F79
MMSSKLDSVTSREWEEFRNTLDNPPTLEQFTTFISNRSDLLETLDESKSSSVKANRHPDKQKNFFVVAETHNKANKPKYSCPMCAQNHFLFSCDSFRKLSVDLRQKKVNELDICQLCLRPGHQLSKCRLSTCKYCSERHNTLLHTEINSDAVEVAALTTEKINLTQQSSALLSTALVRVSDAKGALHVVRIMLDNCSSTNFISERLRSKLQLPVSYTGSTVTESCARGEDQHAAAVSARGAAQTSFLEQI